MRLSLHLVLGLVHSRSVHSRSVHSRSVHSRSVHSRSVHSRSVHSRSVHSRSVHSRSVHSVESVVFQSCIVSRPYLYSLLDNVNYVIYTLVSYPGNSTAVT